MLTQLSEWARLGFIRRTGTGTYALDPPTGPLTTSPTNSPPNLPGVVTAPDGDEKQNKVKSLQRGQDKPPCTATSAVHTQPTPKGDTPSLTASWT